MAMKDEFASKVMGEVDAMEASLAKITLLFNQTAESLPAKLEISFAPTEKRLRKIAERIEKNAERNSLITYSVAIAGMVAAFGGGVLFSSTAISATWVFGVMVGAVIGSALTVFAISRVENKYGEKTHVAALTPTADPEGAWSVVMGSSNRTITKSRIAGTNTEQILAEREKK